MNDELVPPLEQLWTGAQRRVTAEQRREQAQQDLDLAEAQPFIDLTNRTVQFLRDRGVHVPSRHSYSGPDPIGGLTFYPWTGLYVTKPEYIHCIQLGWKEVFITIHPKRGDQPTHAELKLVNCGWSANSNRTMETYQTSSPYELQRILLDLIARYEVKEK
jgi:hypothetical protein